MWEQTNSINFYCRQFHFPLNKSQQKTALVMITFSFFFHLIWDREVVASCSPVEELATKYLHLLSSTFCSAECSSVLACFLTSALFIFQRFLSAPFEINLETIEDHSHNIYKRFHIKCWMQKSLQVMQLPSYILQCVLSFLNNLVYKRF